MEDATLGGYLRKHQRPPAFGGPDGHPYSVDVLVDHEPDGSGRYGAALLFVRWSESGDAPDGHVETDYVAFGSTPADAERQIGALSLHAVKDLLDRAVAARNRGPDW